MPIPTKRFAPGVLLLTLTLGGCGVYQKYGYGRVVDSKLDPAEQTPVVLPLNAPSISQRFRPEKEPSKSDHRGFDILVPTGTPVLAPSDGEAEPAIAVKVLDPQLFWVDGVGKITCYDKARSFPASPIALTYPVPCLGLDWQ